MRSSTGPVGGYRRPAHSVNPPVSVDFVLDFSTCGVLDFFRANGVDLRPVLPDNLFARRVRPGTPSGVRNPVRRQDAGVATPHTRIGFLPRSAPASPCCGDGSQPWFTPTLVRRGIFRSSHYGKALETGRAGRARRVSGSERSGPSTVEGVVESLCGMRVSLRWR